MERQKRWHLFVIIAVIALTIYNILPTVFYYTKPLKSSIDDDKAYGVAENMVERVNILEGEAESWLRAFAKNIEIEPVSIKMRSGDSQLIDITFKSERDTKVFKRFLPEAGSRIPFAPAQLGVVESSEVNQLVVQRKVGVKIDPQDVREFFTFSPKYDANGNVASVYRNVVYDRVAKLCIGFGGSSFQARNLDAILSMPVGGDNDEVIVSLARDIVDYTKLFGENNDITKRYYASFSQIASGGNELIPRFIQRLQVLRENIAGTQKAIETNQKKLQAEGQFLEVAQQQQLEQLTHQHGMISSALKIVKKKQKDFELGVQPLDRQEILASLRQTAVEDSVERQVVNIGDNNPFVAQLVIDWSGECIKVKLHKDVKEALEENEGTELHAYRKDKIHQIIVGTVARVAQFSDEEFVPRRGDFVVHLNHMTDSDSFLLFDLGVLAAKKSDVIKKNILETWKPEHDDLQRNVFPVNDFEAFKSLSFEDQSLGLLVYAPILEKQENHQSFRMNSIYVIAKGLNKIVRKYEKTPEAAESQIFLSDFSKLNELLQQQGFFGYPGNAYSLGVEYRDDYIFELNDYFGSFLMATREDFVVHGSQRYAVLEFTDVEQRIIATNKINRSIHEDLLRWRDEHQSAQIATNPAEKYLVPAPTQNAFWQNFKINSSQYFHGDDRKIIHWGLDLAGGKSVRIGLKDQNNRIVKDKNELSEGANELYERVNKMGVSEVNIRVEGNNIALEFPGSQNLSAEELITASSMTFHVVNEKFSSYNPALKSTVSAFLQEVWNEAIVTNRKNVEDINEIAWRHLGGSYEDIEAAPRSEHAQILYDNGLRLAGPYDEATNSFNDTVSKIAQFRGEDYRQWHGQAHPLVMVFHNYALEGSCLEGVRAEYNSSRGNVLVFAVKNSYGSKEGRSGNPQDDLYAWTSQYAEGKIAGTSKEEYSNGQGWRMGVILNDYVITAPHLSFPLRAHGEVSGSGFTQRSVSQLAADLKAGSLSYTPQILSEQNISPELGKSERNKGIMATFLGLTLVVAAMVGYYYFSGVVASVAVFFNLLIMWGVLQNLDAALTLPGIAGIILTIGMAVDANVLVFERIREEFKTSKRISSAIQAGYRKAFSAIIDSNLTTMLAALILMHFDSGPIKGFAVTLIIGIASSMFTALFMTRYFFTWWAHKHKHKVLTMRNLVNAVNYDFLGKAKVAFAVALVVIVIGGFFCVKENKTMLGMSFTGGYSVTLPLEKSDVDYRQAVEEALYDAGAANGDFEVRTLNQPNIVQVQFGVSMNQEDHPFYGMGDTITTKNEEIKYQYEKNPRLTWVVDALQTKNLTMGDFTLTQVDSSWSTISGQFSDTMRNQALMALGFAVLFILIYLSLRFEFKYAISAIICLLHDVLVTMGVLGILHVLGVPIQIDLQTIGALMTIIGYSLNDTIIIFDRIREDIHLNKKMDFHLLVNSALNKTLGRTLMTSLTTLLVLVALVTFGGDQIFDFALVMMVGVIFGTLSSWFIASPVMLYFHSQENKKKQHA
jgi:SecD/SecF fusion protein